MLAFSVLKLILCWTQSSVTQLTGLFPQLLETGSCSFNPLSSKTHIPNILPELICRNALGLTFPPFTIGTFASRVYVLNASCAVAEALSHSSGLEMFL